MADVKSRQECYPLEDKLESLGYKGYLKRPKVPVCLLGYYMNEKEANECIDIFNKVYAGEKVDAIGTRAIGQLYGGTQDFEESYV